MCSYQILVRLTYTVKCSIVLSSTGQCSSVQYIAVKGNLEQDSTVQNRIVQYNIQHRKI